MIYPHGAWPGCRSPSQLPYRRTKSTFVSSACLRCEDSVRQLGVAHLQPAEDSAHSAVRVTDQLLACQYIRLDALRLEPGVPSRGVSVDSPNEVLDLVEIEVRVRRGHVVLLPVTALLGPRPGDGLARACKTCPWPTATGTGRCGRREAGARVGRRRGGAQRELP